MSETGESETRDDVAGSSTDTTREMLEVIARGGIDFQSSDDMRSTPGSKKKKKKKKKKKTDVIASFEVDVEPPHLFPDDQEPPVPSEQEIMEFDGQWPPWQGGQFSPKGRTPRQRPFVQRGSWGRGNRGGNGSKFMNMQQPFRGQNFSGRGGRFQHPTQFNPQEDNTEFMGSLYPDFDSNIHNNMGGPGTPHNNRGGPRPPPHMGGPQSSPHTFQDRMHDGKRGQPSLLGDGPMQFRMGQRFGGEHQFGPGEGPRNFGPHHREQFPGFHGDSHMQHHEEMIGYDSNSPLPHQQFEDRSHAPEHNPHHSQVNKPDFAKGMPPLPLDFKLPDFAKQQEELLQELSKAPGPPTGPTSETTTESVIPDALDHIPMPPPPQKSSAPQPQPPPPPPPPQAQPQPRLPELVVPQPPLPQEPASLPLPQQPTIPQPPLPQQPSILPSQPPAVLPWQINNHATPSLPQTHPEVPLLPQTQPHPVAPPLPHPVAPLPQTLILAQSSPHMHPVAPPMQQSSQVGTMPPTTFITEEPAKQQVDTEPSDTQTCIPNVEPSPIQMDISPSTIEDNINETNPQQSSEGNPADSSDTQTLHAIDPIKSTAMKLLEKFQMKKKAESQTQENEGGNPQGKKGLINLRSGLRPGTQKSKVSLSSSSRIQFALKNSAKVTGQSNPLKIRSSIGDDEDDVKPEESNKESSDGSPSLSIVKEKSLKSEQTVSHNPSLNEKETDFGHKTKETSNDKEIVVVKTTEPRSNQGSHDNHDRSSSPKSKDLSGSWARSKDYRKKTRSPEVERKTRNSDSRRKNREYRGRSKSPESIDRKSRFSRRRQSTDEEGSPDSVDRNRKNRSRGHVEKSRSKTPDARPDSSDSRKSKTTKDHERSLSPESRSRKDSYSEKVKNKHSGESVHRSSRERSEERRSKRSSRLKERSQRSSSASDTEEKYVQKSKRKESIEREKRGKSEDERLHGTESSNDENKSSHKNIISEQKTDRNASKRGKSEENEERNLHHQYVSDSRHGKDSSEGRQGNSEVIVKKDDKEVNEGSSSPIITLEIRSKWDDKENSETGEACQKHEDDEISHWKPSPDYNREREKSEEALMHRKRDVKGCYDERPRRHSLDRERDYQKVSGRSEDLDRDKTRKVDESQQDEHRLVKKDKRQISPDREEPRRRRSRRHQSSPEQTESNRKSRWSRGGENKNQEDEHSVKNPLVSYDSPMKEVVPLVSYDSPMKGAVPLVSYDSPKTISPVPSSIVKLRPLVQYDSEDDSDTDSGNKDTKVCNESETTKKTGVSEQRISMEVDNIQSAENSKCVTAIIETSGKIPNSISGEVTNMETDRTLPVVGVTKGADAEKESENNQTFPSVSNKIIQAYEDFEKFLNETSFDSKTVVSETSETDKNSTVTEPEITKDNSCRSANESEIHLANDSKTTDTFDVKSISDTSGGVSTSSAGLDRETSGTQLKKPETVMPDNTLEEKSGRRSLRSRRSHTSESQESSPRESRRSKRMSKEEKVSNEAVTPEAGRMTRSRRLRSLDDSEAVEDQSTGKRTEITEEGKTGRRKTRSQHSVDESRDSSRETRSSKRSRRHRNPSGSSSDHEKEDKSLKSPKEIHSDKKLSSPLSVDLSSIALPGEGIKIRIFSDIHSPDKKGEKTGEKQKTELENCDQEVPPAVIDLDSIVLPPEPSKPPEATKQLLTEPTPEEPPPPPPPPPVAMETESVKESDVAIDKPAMPEAAKVEDKNKKFIGVKNEKLRAAMEKLQAEKNADNAEVKEEKVKEIKEQPGKISLSFGRRLTRGRVLKTPSVLTDDDSETRQLIKFGLPKVIAPLKTVPTWEVDENSKELKSDPREKCDSVLPKSDLLVKCDNVVPKPEAKLGQNIPKADSFVMYESESTKIQSDESETKQTGIKIEVKGIRTRSKFKDLPETGTASKPEPIVRQRSWRKSSKSQIFETEDASNSSSIGSDVGTGSDVCTGSDFKQAVDELPSSDGDTRIPHIEEGSPEIEKGSPEKVEETSGADSSLSGQVKLDLVSESTPAIKHSAQQDIVRHHTQVDDEIFFKNIPMPSPPNAVIDNEGTNYENQDMDLDEDSETEMEPEPEVVAKSEENSEKGFIKEDKSSQKENPNVTKDNATYIQSESRILNLSGIKDIVLPDEHLESENRASHTNTTKEALSMNKDTTLSSLKDIALPCENKGPLGSESRASYQDTTKESLSVNKEKIFSSLKDIALPGENKGPMCVESTPAQIEGTKDIFGVNKDVVDSSETNLTYKLPSQNVDVPTGFSAESKSTEEKKREPVSIKPFTIGRKSEKIIVNIKTIIESPIKETPDIPNDKNSLTQTRQNKDVTQSVPSLDDKMPEVTSNVTLEDGKRPTDNKGKAREGTLDSTRCDQEVRPQSIISSPGGIPMEIISEEAIKLRKVSFIGRELMTQADPKPSMTIEADSVSATQNDPAVLELAQVAESEKEDSDKTMSGTLLTDKVLCSIPLPDMELPSQGKRQERFNGGRRDPLGVRR
ncbi:protein piccolo-like isoform X2 [Pecten maximus]|uniref:protein piccolo-like isoform X2 n=1 Tax=Pecten maximus TaxID=6579 RepID=UPI0014590B58|nr:protein piccolo-like isoform X2 [Pecten maximus]